MSVVRGATTAAAAPLASAHLERLAPEAQPPSPQPREPGLERVAEATRAAEPDFGAPAVGGRGGEALGCDALELVVVEDVRDGARLEWTEDTLLSAETAQYTVGLAPGDDGAVMLLVARVSYVNADGRQLHSVGLRGRFVVAREGAYTESEETFTSYISETPFVDPHAGLDLDEEVAP